MSKPSGRVVLAIVGIVLLSVLAVSVLAIQAQDRRWQEIQQRFDVHTEQLIREDRIVISAESRITPVGVKWAAFFTHWYAIDGHQNDVHEGLTLQLPSQCCCCCCCPSQNGTVVTSWEDFHSTIVARNITTIYYWDAERPSWFTMSTGSFYAVDGENIYILLDWSE